MNDGVMNGLLMWREITFNYTQILIAALVLPIFFVRQVLAIKESGSVWSHINIWSKMSWFLLGGAILLGLVHQVWITNMIDEWYKSIDVFDPRVHWLFYGFIGCAVGGLISFGIGCVVGIRNENAKSSYHI
jgi:hypothetical protein